MAAFEPKMVAVLVLALIAQHWAQPANGQSSGVTLSCPPGWLVQAARGIPVYFCIQDPCYGVNPCGPGNTCNSQQDESGAIANCIKCNPPYRSGSIFLGFRSPGATICYLPGRDACNPNPCQNSGVCSYRTSPTGEPLTDDQGTKFGFQCACGDGYTGRTCSDPIQETPKVTATFNGVTGPLAGAVFGVCGQTNFQSPLGCLYADGKHFVCCIGAPCGPVGADGVPICPGGGFTPTPNDFPVQTQPPDQGVCGSGDAAAFPTRCWFSNDPQSRYVCCDNQGCDGFNADNLTPHCKNYGFVPPNNGLPGPTPPHGDQGVCGSGAASAFPTRCWFNSDPQGRYVCCDNQGCDGFNADNLTPHCKKYGYVPPNNGLAGPSTPSTPPSGSQGVCGTGGAKDFPTRCWFNNDPQGRYVCCDNDGCDGFNPPDYLFPHCKTNGYVPPGYGI